MSTFAERKLARDAALRRDPSLAQHIAPRKPVQRLLDPRPVLMSHAVANRRPRLGPPQDQA